MTDTPESLTVTPLTYEEDTTFLEGLVDFIQVRTELRDLIQLMYRSQKITVATLACNLIDSEPRQAQVVPSENSQFEKSIQSAIELLSQLSPEVLSEIACEILEDEILERLGSAD